MATDRLLDVADIVAARLKTVWQPAQNSEVSRAYGIEEDLTTVVGRKLRVFPIGDGEVRRLDRATVEWSYRLGILGYERFEDPGLPPAAWMDDRVKWMREVVFDTLNVDRESEFLGTPATLYTQVIDRPLAYDFDMYRDSSMFWSGIELELREKIAG